MTLELRVGSQLLHLRGGGGKLDVFSGPSEGGRTEIIAPEHVVMTGVTEYVQALGQGLIRDKKKILLQCKLKAIILQVCSYTTKWHDMPSADWS